MFDRYMLVENSLRYAEDNGVVKGYLVDIHYPHHCGIWLSIIEAIHLSVDGNPVDPEKMSLILHGKSYPVLSLTDETTDRWYFGQAGTLFVEDPDGLAQGTHVLTLEMALRVSFLNWFLTGEDTKTMNICIREEKEQ